MSTRSLLRLVFGAVVGFATNAWGQPCPTNVLIEPLAGVGSETTVTELDIGWTGLGHHRDMPDGYVADLAVSCPGTETPCGSCTVDGLATPLGRCSNDESIECDTVNAADADDCGGATCDYYFLPPIPLNVGSVPVCFVNRLESDVSGTVDPDTGSAALVVDTLLDIFLGTAQNEPCPFCVGDAVANDGVPGGLCNGGDRDGLACDTNGIDLTFGETSFDCPPPFLSRVTGTGARQPMRFNTGVNSINRNLACDPPLGALLECGCTVCENDTTIGCISNQDCADAGVSPPDCGGVVVGNSRFPNQCNSGVCNDTGDGIHGQCTSPIDDDDYCDGFLFANGEPVLNCATNADCIAVDPVCPGGDCGNCTLSLTRRCYLGTVVASGSAEPTQPVLASLQCMPPTTTASVNAVLGLPGAHRLRLEARLSTAGAVPDNCPDDPNPDQLNSDCPNASFFTGGGCSGVVPPDLAGCCDGGDVCDVCPASSDNTRCDADRTASATIGPDGDVINTAEVNGTISAKVSIPAGALTEDTSISITENGPATRFGLKSGTATVLSVSARPEGQHFNLPVEVTLRWDDRDMDGIVDRGRCEGGADDGLPCDSDPNDTSDCAAPGRCQGGGKVDELDLVLKRNSSRFSMDGFGVSPFTCADHLAGSGCETATADCSVAAGTGLSAVAKCCDPGAGSDGERTFGEWTFETCDFSELFLGLMPGDLVAGKGSFKTDCITEWAVHNPLNPKYLDNKDLPNFKQTCRDGDPVCDIDGTADGVCTILATVCTNLDDPRLVKKGVVECAPSDLEQWELKRPRLDSEDQAEVLNAFQLLNVMSNLGTTSSPKPQTLVYAPAITQPETCADWTTQFVPLGGENLDKKGKMVLKAKATTSPPAGKKRGTKDSDKLKITCLPGF